jgi:hypothetical protein
MVPKMLVAVIVTVVDESDAVGVPLKIPVTESKTNP